MRGTARTATWLALALTCGMTLAAGAAADDRVRIAGSDTMAPFLRALADELALSRPGLHVDVLDRGSSTGPPALLRGEADIASMTRPMKRSELAAFAARLDGAPRAASIATDAVAVYVNAENPLERLTREQLDAIFSTHQRCGADGPLERWGELGLGAPFRGRKIGVYVTPPASGTQGFFRAVALCSGAIRRSAREQPGTGSVLLAVAANPFGIGYGTRAARHGGVKALALEASDGDGFATIAPPDVRSGRYPLSRPLLLYTRPGSLEPSSATAAFVEFARSKRGQEIIETFGFLPTDPTDPTDPSDSTVTTRPPVPPSSVSPPPAH